ncbi:MAG TPA: hypothetical protein VFV39_01480 [Limnobacter sp.]|nr:hypothetical protein [Limnobacter sp.]
MGATLALTLAGITQSKNIFVESNMPQDIWTITQQLSRLHTIGVEQFGQVLPAKLTLRDHHPENAYQRYFSEESVQLAGAIRVTSIELRIPSANHTGPSLANLALDGNCITKAALESHYTPLTLIDVPRGSSVYEQFVYEHKMPGATLRFGFPEQTPDCLKGLTVEWS